MDCEISFVASTAIPALCQFCIEPASSEAVRFYLDCSAPLTKVLELGVRNGA